MDIRYNDLHTNQDYIRLTQCSTYDYNDFSVQRIHDYAIKATYYQYNYAAKSIGNDTRDILVSLAESQQIIEKYQHLYHGALMNTGEQRMVLHHALRGTLDGSVVVDGRDYTQFYKDQREKSRTFSRQVRKGITRGLTGKQFKNFVQIGIGGSDLGPRALYIALTEYARCEQPHALQDYVSRFVSNVDPDDLYTQLHDLSPEETLFIIVSKSGTTQETLTNEFLALEWLGKGLNKPSAECKKHLIAVTSETSPMARSGEYLESVFIDDYIGGRYSVTSPVGICMFDLSFGDAITDRILVGAHRVDKEADNHNILENAPALDALIGVYERNVLGYPYTAVLPYSQALARFPAHLQQLDMESNGKQVNREGKEIAYQTGPVLFGEPGTNGQHSFYQLLHQGTDIVPLQFIGFHNSQRRQDLIYQESTSQTKLNANLSAQIIAFALGKQDSNPHKRFKGGRPSSVLVADRLTPEALGAILAHYENKVMFQGFLWNINSFDQEGVQLGKLLTTDVLSGAGSSELMAYASLLGIGH